MTRKKKKKSPGKVTRRIVKPVSLIDCVFVGDGIVQGPAYKYAGEHPDQRVVVVEPANLCYEPLGNMEIVRADAIKYFRGLAPESVRFVRDDFSFEWVTEGIAHCDIEEQLRRSEGLRKKVDYVMATSQPTGKYGKKGSNSANRLPNIHRNATRYTKGVSYALVYEGRFVLTTTKHNLEKMEKHLQNQGFLVDTGVLSEGEVLKMASIQALQEYSQGNSIYEIVAVKPNERILQEKAQREEKRAQQEKKMVARSEFLRRAF